MHVAYAPCYVGAVLDAGAHVKNRLVKIKSGEEEIIRHFVFVGEYEVVEARLFDVQGHLQITGREKNGSFLLRRVLWQSGKCQFNE